MRILHLTDTHLGATRRVHGGPAGWERALDHRAAMEAALAHAVPGEIDLVVHSGDLFDRTSPDSEDAWWAYETLETLSKKIPVLVCAGSHARRGLARHLPHRPGQLVVVDRDERVELAGLTLGVVAYARTAKAWAQRAARVCAEGVDLLVTHQPMDGAEVAGLTFRAGRRADTVGVAHLPDAVRLVLCGYVHRRQVLQVGDAVVVCPGGTERTAFSERFEQKGFAIWERVEGRWSHRFVDIPTRPMVVVDREEDLSQVREGCLVSIEAEPWEALASACQQRGALVVHRPLSRDQVRTLVEDDQVALPLGAVAYLPTVRALRDDKKD